MWIYNGRVIREGRAWTNDNGIKHPASWSRWTAAEKANAGLVEVTVQPQPDARFYWVTGPNLDGTWSSVARALEDIPTVDDHGVPVIDPDTLVQLSTPGLKSQWIAQIKATQGSLLAQTDWAYIRKQDTGAAVPADIQTYRDEVRLAGGIIEGQIAACADLAAFKVLFDTPVDAAGVPTGNAPINDWPRVTI
jgi:hypothetical protein